MPQQRWPTDGLKIRLLAEYEIPVADPQEPGQGRRAQLSQFGGQDERGKRQRYQQQHQQRRHEASRASAPEGTQIDLTLLSEFFDKQSSDQEAADNKEDFDAEKTALQRAGVVQQHSDHSQPAQSIESRQVRNSRW